MKIEGRIAKVNPNTAYGRLSYNKEKRSFTLRLDDTTHLDFWMEIEITPEDMFNAVKESTDETGRTS